MTCQGPAVHRPHFYQLPAGCLVALPTSGPSWAGPPTRDLDEPGYHPARCLHRTPPDPYRCVAPSYANIIHQNLSTCWLVRLSCQNWRWLSSKYLAAGTWWSVIQHWGQRAGGSRAADRSQTSYSPGRVYTDRAYSRRFGSSSSGGFP